MTIELNNYTNFPIMRFSNLDNAGKEFGVIMLKVAFDIGDDGMCMPSIEQEPFNFTDLCHGELNTSSLKLPSDMVSYKPVTDVILNVATQSPTDAPQTSWLCGFEVRDEKGLYLKKQLKVYGPRHWKPKWKRALSGDEQLKWHEHRENFERWILSEAKPIRYLPIQYEYAYGGCIFKGKDADIIYESYEYNPVGRGFIDKEWTDHTKTVEAPQIEWLEKPIINPYEQYKPAGFGAIPPAWLPRRPLGGTYDQNWLDNVWPSWPPDYNFRFNNASVFQADCNRFLEEHIEVSFSNIVTPCQNNNLRIRKPILYANVKNKNQNEEICRLNMDTLLINLADKKVQDCRIFCLWRIVYDMLETEEINIFSSPDWIDPLDINSGLKSPPHPSNVAQLMVDIP